MPLKILLSLALCNAIWATNPSFGKILLTQFTPAQSGWLRYTVALLSCALFLPFFKVQKINKRHWLWLGSIGVITFFLSPFFQYRGLHASTATANTILVAIEPITAALLAWLFLKEHLSKIQKLSLGVAIIGFIFLSKLYSLEINPESVGNIFLLLVMPAEAMYSVLSRKLGTDLNAFTIFSIALPIGWLLLTLYTASTSGLPNISLIGWKEFFILIWMGMIGTTLSYMYWAFALKDAPVGIVSLTLFVQPLLGTFFGIMVLKEKLSFMQWIGAAAILLSLYLSIKKPKHPRSFSNN